MKAALVIQNCNLCQFVQKVRVNDMVAQYLFEHYRCMSIHPVKTFGMLRLNLNFLIGTDKTKIPCLPLRNKCTLLYGTLAFSCRIINSLFNITLCR